MQSQVFILMGKSGSGKGTQADMLIDTFKKQGQDIHRVEMGHAFRDFLRQSNYTAQESLQIARDGGLQPDFLANYFLAADMIKYFNGSRSFILDGTPRTVRQARIIDGALKFYGIKNPIIIHLDVSDESVIQRMQDRGRGDDQINAIKTRLDWFREDTLRAIDFFSDRDYYKVYRVDGERDVESIHQDIIKLVTQEG